MQIKRNPWLRTLYLTMLLPVASGVVAIALVRHALVYEHTWSDRTIEFTLALLAAALAVKCWGVTLEFVRDMRCFLDTMRAVKRGEFVLHSARTGLPEIEELA